MVASAADPTYINNLLAGAGNVLQTLMPVIVVLGIVYFLWSVFQFMRAEGDQERAEKRAGIAWSVVALFVIVSVWPLVLFVNEALNINPGGSAPLPGLDDDPGTADDAPPAVITPAPYF